MVHFYCVVLNCNKSSRNARNLHHFGISKDLDAPGRSSLVILNFESVFRLLLFAMLLLSLKTMPIKPVHSKNRAISLLVRTRWIRLPAKRAECSVHKPPWGKWKR